MCRLAIALIWIALSGGNGQAQEKEIQPCGDSLGENPIKLSQSEALKRVIHCESPIMPDILRRASISGRVILEIAVDPAGKVNCIRTLAGHALLKGSAIDAAKKWVFRPVIKDGVATGFITNLAFVFSLTSKPPEKGDECLRAGWDK
jgi:TonB family protein